MPITPSGASLNYAICPFCKTHAQYLTKSLFYTCEHEDPPLPDHHEKYDVSFTVCSKCEGETIWHESKIIYPPGGNDIPRPNADLPSDIQNDYIEAASIVDISPRGAICLIRLGIEKLCNHVLKSDRTDYKNKSINDAIDELTRTEAIPKHISNSLDIVRLTGNEGVHLGTMNLDNDVETARNLFSLVNECAEHMLTSNKMKDKLVSNLPEKAQRTIEKRTK